MPKAKKGLQELESILTSLRQISQETTAYNLIESLIRRIDYLNYLDDGTIQGESRKENVEELLSVAKQYQDQGLNDFLEEVALISENENTKDKTGNSITLMTLHSAKGLEFPIVFMVGMEETILPHTRAHYDQHDMEEERRLCYVGMTRAKQQLYLLYANSRVLYGGVQHNPPSRFLSEIDSLGLDSARTALSENPFLTPRDSDSGSLRDSSLPSVPSPHKDLKETRYVPELSEGDKVDHQVFGTGVVLELNGDTATIFFKNKGSKKLDISFAPLTKVD